MRFIDKNKIQPHPRICIRKRVKSLLVDNIDLSNEKLFCTKPHPRFRESLPCLFIYFPEEGSSHNDSAPRLYKHELMLVTEVQIQTSQGLDEFIDPETGMIIDSFEEDWLDSRAWEISKALGTSINLMLPGFVQDCELVRTVPAIVEYDGDVDASALQMYWKITWKEVNTARLENLDEFLSFGVEYNCTNGAKAVDDVTIREKEE